MSRPIMENDFAGSSAPKRAANPPNLFPVPVSVGIYDIAIVKRHPIFEFIVSRQHFQGLCCYCYCYCYCRSSCECQSGSMRRSSYLGLGAVYLGIYTGLIDTYGNLVHTLVSPYLVFLDTAGSAYHQNLEYPMVG